MHVHLYTYISLRYSWGEQDTAGGGTDELARVIP